MKRLDQTTVTLTAREYKAYFEYIEHMDRGYCREQAAGKVAETFDLSADFLDWLIS